MASPNPRTASARIKKLSRLRPTLALVLGSGFNHVLRELDVDVAIPYAKLPGFPKPGVAGHEGKLFIGKLGGTPVLVLSGRAHFYEGDPMGRGALPGRVVAALGIRRLFLSHAGRRGESKFWAGRFTGLPH